MLLSQQQLNHLIISLSSTNIYYQLSSKMTFTSPSTSRDDFPYFETHYFDGWARQFRTMADSVDNGCSIAFDPMPGPSTDEEGNPIPQTPAQVRALTILQEAGRLCTQNSLGSCHQRKPRSKKAFRETGLEKCRRFLCRYSRSISTQGK